MNIESFRSNAILKAYTVEDGSFETGTWRKVYF